MEGKEIIMYFSVKVPVKIGDKKFLTCICYELTEFYKDAVEKLVAEGKAVKYETKRFFCNGKLLPTAEEKRREAKKTKKALKEASKEAQKVPVEEVSTEDTVSEEGLIEGF